MAAAKRSVAELESLIENLPELIHVAVGRAGHIDEVDRDNALIEAAVVLVGSVGVQANGIGSQEGSAAHAGIHIAVLVLLHLLCGDVVRHHALCRAAGSQLRQIPVLGILVDIVLIEHIDELRECRGDPDALLVLDALHALAKDLLDDHRKVLSRLSVRHLIEVHEHRDERRLAVAGHQGDQLILDGLNAALDLLLQAVSDDLLNHFRICVLAALLSLLDDFLADLLAGDIDKRSKVRERERLTAVLVRSNLSHDLGRDVAGGEEAVRLLDHRLADDGAVLQHVLEVDEVAVVFLLRIVIGIVEMDQAFLMCLHDVLRQEQTLGQVLADLAGHVVTLRGVDDRVLVGVLLLHLLVHLVDESKDSVVGGVGLAGDLSLVAVANVLLCHLIPAHLHDTRLHHVLDVLDVHRMGGLCHLLCDLLGDRIDLVVVQLIDAGNFDIGLADGIDDLCDIKCHLLAIALDHIGVNLDLFSCRRICHESVPSFLLCYNHTAGAACRMESCRFRTTTS